MLHSCYGCVKSTGGWSKNDTFGKYMANKTSITTTKYINFYACCCFVQTVPTKNAIFAFRIRN